ncbi:hypothetical protein LEN26_016076, partial [Aphanomyces euteiches]
MTKVYEVRRTMATVSYTRWSIVYNVIFVLNLVSTPFMAYLGEPYPGPVGSRHLPEWTTFEDFVNVTASYFKQLYNNHTMEKDEASRREVQMNMFALRRDLTLPYEIPEDHTVDYMIRMPGVAALFFSYGQRHFISNFLMSNET